MKIQLPPKRNAFVLVSMADIAFLLLIFLVLTVTTGDGGRVNLPEFLYGRRASAERSIDITVGSDGSMSLDGTPLAALPSGSSPVDEALTAAINRRLIGEGGALPIVRISADRDLPYERVDALLSTLKSEGLTNVVLMTEPKRPRGER